MTTLTFIDPKNNNCKVYHINGTSSLYGRIGCTMRSGVVKGDTESKKIGKGYRRTMLVSLPQRFGVYAQIKMLRYENGTWQGYGYLDGYYRPLGFSFTSEQVQQFGVHSIGFEKWNRRMWKI